VTGPAIRRGEVWWVSFHGSIGGEIRKTRPCIIVSNDRSNEILNRVQVVALTTKINRVSPGETLVRLGPRTQKAMANQLHTVDKRRCLSREGAIGEQDMLSVENAIVFQLSLSRAERQ
jgi:mRNA interferase MazF